jgi:subtilisin-like proprotein convertase family protein
MPYTSIPDNSVAGIASSIRLDEDVRVETVEVYLTVEHPAWGDLHVSLTSPEGTVSELAASGSRDDLNGYDNWCFSTVRSMGESSRGSWTLRVADEYPVDVGRLVSWTVKAYGSATATAAVTPKVTLKLSGLKSGAMKLGRSVTAKGKVTPTSLARSKVKLTVQKKRGSKWVTVKSMARTTSASSAYSWKYKPAKRGAYHMRATIAKTAAHTAAKTKWRTFKVK